jgi:hypothetical protein
MALKNSYEYIRECCGTFVFKQSIMDLKDTILEGAKGESSTMNLQGGPSYTGGVNGMLYKKTYVNHCCGAPHCCGMRSSYEIEGYNTRLAETKIPSYITFYLDAIFALVLRSMRLLTDKRRLWAT